MDNPNIMIEKLMTVKAHCRFDENSFPFFLSCHSHSSGGSASAHVSQLAKYRQRQKKLG